MWSEPNHYYHLFPQYNGDGSPASPAIYRALLERFEDAVHQVAADNVVIAGNLHPFTVNDPATPGIDSVGPLRFMRALLCMSDRNKPLPGCKPLHFDGWGHHPYTSGNPTHHAFLDTDVSLGDLGKMKRLLDASVKAGHVVPRRKMRFLATEFSWDTNPPDPGAVPLKLHTRWVAEALYRMWTAGMDSVTWYLLRDDENNDGRPNRAVFQSGLYFHCPNGIKCDKPKPALQAFRFPFVAFLKGGRISVWGRTPNSKRGRVAVEQRSGGRWARLTTLSADRYGIFRTSIRPRGRGDVRARMVKGSAKAVPFSLKVPPDRPGNPFG
jgi:hypothetical protein